MSKLEQMVCPSCGRKNCIQELLCINKNGESFRFRCKHSDCQHEWEDTRKNKTYKLYEKCNSILKNILSNKDLEKMKQVLEVLENEIKGINQY